MEKPKVTFGIIVLNGEPFTRYCLRALYPHAHEIIIVEGACPGAHAIATEEGHSRDDTLEVLRNFKAEEDSENKVHIVTAEDEGYPNGFWPGEKHEQSQAYAKRATGDYVWQVDIDEFYMPGDLERILEILHTNPQITAVSFRQIQFWGGLSYFVDSWRLRRGAEHFHRLFRWEPGSQYVSHRPPTVLAPGGEDTREIEWMDGYQLAREGIRLYHYSFIFPKQVREKSAYYASAAWANRPDMVDWAKKVYFGLQRPFRMHNASSQPGWLEKYEGEHPPQVLEMIEDIKTGHIDVEMRSTEDIDRMTSAVEYRLARTGIKAWEPVDRYLRRHNVQSRICRLASGLISSLPRRVQRLFT